MLWFMDGRANPLMDRKVVEALSLLSFSHYLFVYLCIYIPTYLPTFLPTYLSIYLPTYLPIYLSIFLSFFSFFLSLYLSVYLSVYLSDHQSIHLSIYLSLSLYLATSLSIHPSIHLSAYLSSYSCTYLPTYLPIYPFTYASIQPSIHPSSYLSIYLSDHLFTYLSVSKFLHPSTSRCCTSFLTPACRNVTATKACKTGAVRTSQDIVYQILKRRNATPLRKWAPAPLDISDSYVSCTALRLPRDMHLCTSSSNAPRLPTFLKLLQNPHVLLTFGKVQNPLRLPHKSAS